jgi:hypothetical protein
VAVGFAIWMTTMWAPYYQSTAEIQIFVTNGHLCYRCYLLGGQGSNISITAHLDVSFCEKTRSHNLLSHWFSSNIIFEVKQKRILASFVFTGGGPIGWGLVDGKRRSQQNVKEAARMSRGRWISSKWNKEAREGEERG